MNWKGFLKPNWIKITLTSILFVGLILQFLYSLYGCRIPCQFTQPVECNQSTVCIVLKPINDFLSPIYILINFPVDFYIFLPKFSLIIANILIYDVLAIFYYFIISCLIMWVHEKTRPHGNLIIDILSVMMAVGLVITYITFYAGFFMENKFYITLFWSTFLFAELLEIEFNLPRLGQSTWSWKKELTFWGINYFVFLFIFIWAQNIFDIFLSFLLFSISIFVDYWVYYKFKNKK